VTAVGSHRPAAAPALYLGVDLGTSGCRVCVVDDNGNERGMAKVPLPPPDRNHWHSEQQPQVWWRGLKAALQVLWQQVDGTAVRGVAIDGTSATLLVSNAGGRPLGPALMYDDTRARAAAEAVAAVTPPDSAARGPGSSLAKLLYLLEQHPQAHRALHQADWLAGRLCGRFDFSDENNCLKLGYDPQRRRWPAWMERLPLPRALLPEVSPPGTLVGSVDAAVATELGLSPSTRVATGTTDSTAAFLATGAREPGEAVTSLGSTLVLKIIAERPLFSAAHGVYSHRLGDLWLAGGASNSGGAVLLQYFTAEELEELTLRLRPEASTGLDYYPLPRPGERFPINDPDLAPRLEPRPQDRLAFLQGMLEGMARIEARGYRLLEQLGAPALTSVRTVGGGSANPTWRQIRERLLKVPLIKPLHDQAAYGAALLARQALR
jgi:sugar (pentulose or hexulose) kinase